MIKHFKALPLWYHLIILGIFYLGLGWGIIENNPTRILVSLVFCLGVGYWIPLWEYYKSADGQYYKRRILDQPYWLKIGVLLSLIHLGILLWSI